MEAITPEEMKGTEEDLALIFGGNHSSKEERKPRADEKVKGFLI